MPAAAATSPLGAPSSFFAPEFPAGAGAPQASQRGREGYLTALENGLLAARQTLAQVPGWHQVAHHAARGLRYTLPNMAIAAGTGLAFAHTVTPPLLAACRQGGDLGATLDGIWMVGPLLKTSIGAGGHFGLWSASACLLSASAALLTGNGALDKRFKAALAHVAQGFALSPLLHMALTGCWGTALPGLALAGACTLGVSLVLSHVLAGERPDWIAGVSTASLSFAGSSLGAQLALGQGLAAASVHAGLSLALGALLSAYLMWQSNMDALNDDSTALLRRYEVHPDKSRWVNVGRAAQARPERASVFVHSESLHDKILSVLNNQRLGGKLHNERLLLSGPPGTGKTDLAQALANEFNARLFCPPAHLFTDSNTPATVITQVMDQAALEAKRSGKFVLLVLDEAEKLFPDRTRRSDLGTTRGDAAWMMTTTFNDVFEGAGSSRYAQVFVVVITNHPDVTDEAFRSRFSGGRHLRLSPPSAREQRSILASRWRANQPRFAGLQKFTPFQPSERQLDQLVRACAPRQDAQGKIWALSGRDLDQAVTDSLQTANARFGAGHDLRAGAAQQAFCQCVYESFQRAIEALFVDRQNGGPGAPAAANG